MKKRITAIVFALILLFSVSVSAYTITGYELTCDAAMLINMDTGEALYTKNHTKILYPASITKLMTAVVMLEHVPDLENTELVYTREGYNRLAGTGSVAYGMRVGETMNAKDALAALLIASHGDVAYAIAEHVGGTIDRFVEMMNEKAVEMGLANTRYVNPVGLHDDDHYSTAEEICKLAKYAFENEIIREFTSISSYTMRATSHQPARTLYNTNSMLNPNSAFYYPYTVCSKTGFTSKAGRCLVSVAQKGEYRYLAVVLNSKTIDGVHKHVADSTNLYRWAFDSFAYKTVVNTTTPITQMPVNLSSETEQISLHARTALEALLPANVDESAVTVTTQFTKPEVDAPIAKGDILGQAEVFYNGNSLGTVDLVAATDVSVNEWLKFKRDAKVFITSSPWMIPVYVVVGILILFVLLLLFVSIKKKKQRKYRHSR